MNTNYELYKTKLEEEKALVEKELSEVGQRSEENPDNWEAKPIEHGSSNADENTFADKIEEYEDKAAIVNTLERRYKEINEALEKMSSGTYGTCSVCGKEIDEERLKANPSAPTCREHMNIV